MLSHDEYNSDEDYVSLITHEHNDRMHMELATSSWPMCCRVGLHESFHWCSLVKASTFVRRRITYNHVNVMIHVKAVIPSARKTHPSAQNVLGLTSALVGQRTVRRPTKAEVGPLTFLSGLSVPLKGMNVSVLRGLCAAWVLCNKSHAYMLDQVEYIQC